MIRVTFRFVPRIRNTRCLPPKVNKNPVCDQVLYVSNAISLRSIAFSILLDLWFGLPTGAQDFEAAASNFMHPHDVHDVQTDAGEDPSAAATEGDVVEGIGAVHGAHPAVVYWHNGDPDHEKHECHQYPISHVGLGDFGVT